MKRNRLPRRDYILLPALSLLTIVVLFSCAELTARHFFPDDQPDTCFYRSAIGPADRANCVSYERIPESAPVRSAFDVCGYRSLHGCGPKRAGVFRVAVIGSSIAEARLVPLDRTYIALAADSVEFIPVASPLSSPAHSLARMSEVLSLHPDAVLQVLSPVDIETLWMYVRGDTLNIGTQRATPQGRRDLNHYLRSVSDALKDSRAVLAAEHFLFRDEQTYLRLYMLYGYKADYLRQPLSRAWRQRFAELNWVDGQIAARLDRAGIPFYITAFPSRAGAILLKRDPAAYAWGREVEQIAQSNHAHYIDLLHAFAEMPDPGSLFYTVDGHPNEAAQPLLARTLVVGLLGDSPRLRVAEPSSSGTR